MIVLLDQTRNKPNFLGSKNEIKWQKGDKIIEMANSKENATYT